MPRPLSRRTLLRGAGGASVALPFLSAMLRPGRSHAAEAVQKRLIVFFTPNGTVPDAWRPTGGETDFTLSPILSPLERHRDQLLILDGIDMRSALEHSGGSNGHDIGTGHSLTPHSLLAGPSGVGEGGHLWDGSAGGTSFDQAAAAALGARHAFGSLVFGVQCDVDMAIPSRISWKGPFEPVRPMQEPATAFDRIFGTATGDVASRETERSQRLFVVDAVLEDYQRLHARVGAEDRLRLEAHLESLYEVERTIERLDLGACALPERVHSTDLETIGTANLDMMVAALACDLTPVAVHQWGSGQSARVFTELGCDDGHHTLSHEPLSDTAAVAQLTDINTWYAERFADLLDRLAATPAADGQSLLDHSAVMWVNELGNGYTHSYTDIPYVIAGGAGGALSTGRSLRLDSAAHGELFAAVGLALGMDTERFGMEEAFEAPLTEILR